MSQDNNNKPKQQSKPTSVRGQLEYILDQLSHEDLSRFVLDTALYDTEFRETVLITFSGLLGSDASETPLYQERLYKILAQHTNKDGFISNRNAVSLNNAIAALLSSARKPTTPLRGSVDVSMAVLSIMPRLGGYMDDTEGYLYSLMEQVCTVLLECFDDLKPDVQQEVFSQILTFYAQSDYLDLDLDGFLLMLLKDWAQSDHKRQTDCLRVQEAMLKGSNDDQWRKGYLLEQTDELLKHWAGTATGTEKFAAS